MFYSFVFYFHHKLELLTLSPDPTDFPFPKTLKDASLTAFIFLSTSSQLLKWKGIEKSGGALWVTILILIIRLEEKAADHILSPVHLAICVSKSKLWHLIVIYFKDKAVFEALKLRAARFLCINFGIPKC